MNGGIWGPAIAAIMMIGGSTVAMADVKAGVDAWTQGDFAKAVAEWRPLAQAGDADAQFNMGQAYKLGQGVPADMTVALDYFRKAAAQGHARAEDNYGLLLFQQNRRAEAMPYIQRSAERGEARAQYLYGIALFNGDLVAKDWVKAYAMMTRASATKLPQATASLGQMDQYIPADQRRQGLALATQMEQREQATRLASTGATAAAPLRQPPRPLRSTTLPPSTIAGTGSGPALGAEPKGPDPVAPDPATYMPDPVDKAEPAAPPRPGVTASSPAPQSSATTPATAPAPRAAPTSPQGAWRVQLGAFSEAGRAEALWKSLSGKVKILSGRQRYLVRDGGITRLQAGPLANRAEAQKLCGEIQATGSGCFVKAP